MIHEHHGQGVSQILKAAPGAFGSAYRSTEMDNFILLSHQKRLIRLISNLRWGCGDERTGACRRWMKDHHEK
jgi:hypothetical protein